VIGFLRRVGPRNPVLAILYWVALIVVALAVVFTAFWYLDRFLPGSGMF
jgi:hypothetical protein